MTDLECEECGTMDGVHFNSCPKPIPAPTPCDCGLHDLVCDCDQVRKPLEPCAECGAARPCDCLKVDAAGNEYTDATSAERGARALKAVAASCPDWAHLASEGARDESELPSALGDLLADVRHLCDAHGLDYAECDRMAYRHYLEELAEQPRYR